MQGQLAAFAKFANCKDVGWQKDLHRVSHLNIETFLAEREKTQAKATVRKELKILKRLFKLAIVRGHLAKGSNPCDAIPMPVVGASKIVYVPSDEFTTIYSKAVGQLLRTVVLLWYTTGLRRAEAEPLLWDDIDFTFHNVTVVRHSKNGYVQEWSPKDHELRVIPMPMQLMKALLKLKSIAVPSCPYVFMTKHRWDNYREKVDSGLWSDQSQLINNMLRKFHTICGKAGVKKYKIYDLRRSCITNWARKGLPIHVTRELAGHSELETTQKYYLAIPTAWRLPLRA